MADTEEAHLVGIFPNEVWDLILVNVKEVKNFHKISSACPYFQTRLRPHRTKILFPGIMKSVAYHGDGHPDNFLESRAICRAWKIGLDQILQKQKYFCKYEYQLSQMSGMNSGCVDMDFDAFDSVEDFVTFTAHFDATHMAVRANPFVARKVKLVFESETGVPEPFYDACFQFLENYGHHIWFCIIVLNFKDDDGYVATLVDFYNRRLNKLLLLLPNLQALQIEQDVLSDYVPDNEFPSASFPTLCNLEYIYIARVPFPIVESLFQRNLHVKYVDAIQFMIRRRAAFLESLANLRALSVSIGDDLELRNLEQVQFARPVERLWLDLMDLEIATTEQVFRTIERHFSTSLTELHLSLPNNETMGAKTRLELPKLKVLHLEMDEPQRLEFLLPLKDTLEELHLAVIVIPNHEVNCKFELPENAEEETDSEYKFQVYRFWKQPKQSGIWPVFPKLKFLKQKVFEVWPQYRCSRQKWEAESKLKC